MKLLIVIYLWSNFHVNSLCSFEIREGGSKWPPPVLPFSKKPSLGRVKIYMRSEQKGRQVNPRWWNILAPLHLLLLMCLLFLMYICATMCHNMAQNMAHCYECILVPQCAIMWHKIWHTVMVLHCSPIYFNYLIYSSYSGKEVSASKF